MAFYDVNAAIEKPNVFATYLQGQKLGQEQREYQQKQQDTNALRTLAPNILSGDQAAFGQAYAIDPTAATAAQTAGEGQMRKLQNAIGILESASDPRQKEAIYQQSVRPWLNSNSPDGTEPPLTFAEAEPLMLQAKARLATLGPAKGEESYTLSPGAIRFDGANKQVAMAPVAERQQSWSVVNVPDGQGGQQQMEHNAATGEWRAPTYGGQPQQGQPQAAQPQSGGARMVLDDALSQAVMAQESGGDPNAVSSAGARGLMQLMPETARDPGYGIQPLQNESPEENVRLGQDYLQAMLQKYGGNQQLALAAYNGGPGRVDSALQRAGGNPDQAMQFLPAETQAYPGAVQARLGGGQQVAQGQRMGYTPPKSAQQSAPSGYNVLPDGTMQAIPGGPAQIAIDARNDAAAAKESAAAAKAAIATQASERRQFAASESAQGLIDSIDRVTNSAGFGDLGTVTGDLKIGTPFVRNDAKDANANLSNVTGQVALSTMASLRALSAQGATGFGALSAPELKLLQNSITAVDSSELSNEQLASNLKIIRDKMQKIIDWKPSEAGGNRLQNTSAVVDGPRASGGPQRATNPQTGQVIELRNGQWVPVQ